MNIDETIKALQKIKDKNGDSIFKGFSDERVRFEAASYIFCEQRAYDWNVNSSVKGSMTRYASKGDETLGFIELISSSTNIDKEGDQFRKADVDGVHFDIAWRSQVDGVATIDTNHDQKGKNTRVIVESHPVQLARDSENNIKGWFYKSDKIEADFKGSEIDHGWRFLMYLSDPKERENIHKIKGMSVDVRALWREDND